MACSLHLVTYLQHYTIIQSRPACQIARPRARWIVHTSKENTDTHQPATYNILLHADDSCLTVTHKDVKYIEKTLNKNLSSLCEWLVDNKLSIHLLG